MCYIYNQPEMDAGICIKMNHLVTSFVQSCSRFLVKLKRSDLLEHLSSKVCFFHIFESYIFFQVSTSATLTLVPLVISVGMASMAMHVSVDLIHPELTVN